MKSKRTIPLPVGVARHFKNGDKIILSMPFVENKQETGSVNHHPNFGLVQHVKLVITGGRGTVEFDFKNEYAVRESLTRYNWKVGRVEAVVVTSSDKKSEMSFIITNSFVDY